MTKKKRYNLVIPFDIAEQLEQCAVARGDSVTSLINKFCRFGLEVTVRDPDAQLIRKDGDKEVIIMLL